MGKKGKPEMKCKKCGELMVDMTVTTGLKSTGGYTTGGGGGSHSPTYDTYDKQGYYCDNEECLHFSLLKIETKRKSL